MTWHEGVIPKDKVWIKIGGDKGGGTFKQMMQVGNVKHPNSLANTVIVCAFEASDTINNLNIGLLRHKQQVKELMELNWR